MGRRRSKRRPTASQRSEAVLSERPHCLVIDDHPLVRLGVRGVLEDDFEVHETRSREEGVDLVRDIGDFDVAIVDMRWRQNGISASISGPETIRRLHRASPALGIVAHGERPERHIATAALQAGASAYVARTTGPAELRKAVDAAAAQESFVDPTVPPKGRRGKLTAASARSSSSSPTASRRRSPPANSTSAKRRSRPTSRRRWPGSGRRTAPTRSRSPCANA